MAEPVDLIFYNKVMDRIGVKQLISRLISHFGITYTTHVLDQLKTLGFQYATSNPISLGIDDLLTAPSKGWLIEDAEEYTNLSEKHHNYGNLHAVEKLRQLIETWYATSEYLKQEMNPNFRMTDPSNPVHMMSFSGARGSISQVHQLVGMRGLMSDPQGQIIDLPIQSNFREGLSLTEYIISCYGARKGVVDTAVRTSDAGYLTRRLVEVVQRIVIRKMDCGSIYGISVDDFRGKKTFFQQKVIGRVLAENIYINNRCFATRNQDIGASLANRLINLKTEQSICIRSPLTCRSMFWVCQSCYGWSLTNGNLIEIGEAVGIIAGQSIGEPGTQLTLRTFHTGGVFTGDIAEHVRTPFNGIIKFDENSIHPTRTRHGHPAWICHTNLFLKIQSRNKIHNITIPPKSLLLVQNNQYVESKQVIAEVRAKLLPFKEKVQKYIYSNLEGEMYWSTKVRHASDYIHSNIHTILETSHIWILSGKSYKKSDKLPILFYENQDKIDSKTFIAEEKNNISFLGDKNQINISIFNFWIFRRNRISKKSKLIYTIFNNWNNLINSNIILSGYNVAKRDRNLFLHEKDTTPFVLEIKKDGILQNNNVFAISDPPKYKLDKSGILKYGTIRIGSINRSNFEKTKNFRPKYTIIQGGSFFFIPEEVYFSTKNLSSLLIKNNNFIEAGTLITSNVISHMSGLVKMGKGINDNYEIKILPGTIYYPEKFHEISKQINVLIPPGKKIFDELRYNDWSYLQWIMPAKQKPFAFIRPAIKYEISDEYSKTNLLDLLRRNTNLKIQSVSYSFYQDGEQIRILNRKYIQLVQTCLIVQWKEKYFLGKAHMSFLKIRTKNNVRTFIQINLINSVLISNRDNLKKNLSTRYILRKSFYDISPPSPNKKQLVSEHQGIIRISSNENDGIKTFIILSPSNLVGISKINKSPELLIEKTTSYCISNKFFDFHKYQEDFDYYDRTQKTDIEKDKSIQDSIKIRLFDDVGFVGDSVNIKNSLECFYWFVNTKKMVDDSPIRIDEKYAKNFQDPKWYFIDEYHKIYKFIFGMNTNQSLFKWCLRIFPFGERILQKFNLGKFFFDNSSRSKYLENNPSGQIIGINTNYLIIRLAKPYLATRGAILRNNYGEFVKEGDILITLIYERLKSGDIIQGLPKVEQLLEARPINSVSINLENSFEDWNNDMKKFIGNLWGFFLSTKIGMEKGQVILVDQIQKVYQSQGVHVSNKHIEIIVRQMTSKVITLEEGTINIFLPGELIESSRARKMNRILEEPIPYEPILLGMTKASLNTQSFISEASFQETTRVLAKSALKGRIDWLKGLKENVILGAIIPAGTGSQEVVWQMNLENRREVFSSKTGSYFNKKMKNIFLYQNKFFVYPAMETIHNVLKGAISRNELDISSIRNNKI